MEPTTAKDIIYYVIYGVIGLAGLILMISAAISGFFTVEQQRIALVERFGKFVRQGTPGLNFKIPWFEKVAKQVNLRVKQLDVKVETKTKDDVFLQLMVVIQYVVKPEKVYESYYKLTDPAQQITSFVFDVVRAHVPKMKLDDVFEKKDEVAGEVKHELIGLMEEYGYSIVTALVTDIDPDKKVKDAMNEINAAQRMRVAANEKGEADKILRVKTAEGEAQSKALQGKGIADQRKAIIEGLRESVGEFQKGIPGSTANDVMSLVLMTQYFDTLKDIGANSRTNAILIPHSPGGLKDIYAQLRDAIITGGQLQTAPQNDQAPKDGQK